MGSTTIDDKAKNGYLSAFLGYISSVREKRRNSSRLKSEAVRSLEKSVESALADYMRIEQSQDNISALKELKAKAEHLKLLKWLYLLLFLTITRSKAPAIFCFILPLAKLR